MGALRRHMLRSGRAPRTEVRSQTSLGVAPCYRVCRSMAGRDASSVSSFWTLSTRLPLAREGDRCYRLGDDVVQGGQCHQSHYSMKTRKTGAHQTMKRTDSASTRGRVQASFRFVCRLSWSFGMIKQRGNSHHEHAGMQLWQNHLR